MKSTNPRVLKVEEIGDYWHKKTCPSIRLKGQWLQQAGISPNSHVEVTNPKPGVLVVSLSSREKER